LSGTFPWVRRLPLTYVPAICQVRLAVVHAVASLFDHTVSFLSSYLAQLGREFSRRAHDSAASGTLTIMHGRFTQTAEKTKKKSR
jgi:hypothetical protein